MWRHRTLAKLLDEEVSFRCMGIRGQEIWTGPTDRPRKPQAVFTASSPTPTPSHAVKFGDAPLCKVVIGRAMTSRAFHLRTRCPRSAVQGRLAPTKAVSAHSQSLNFQTSSLSDPVDTSFTASSPTPTPLRAAKFSDAPLCQALNVSAMPLRAFGFRMRCPRSAVQGRLAPT